MNACDVLIVGGGPGGSSCAWTLRAAGLDVVVADAAVFPRDKVCAGWITPQVIAELARLGTTAFLSTHYMDEADQLCRRVAFISEGRIVALDTPRELKLRYGRREAHVVLADRSEHMLSLTDPAQSGQLAEWTAAGQVLSVHSREATLDEVFRHLAGREL